MKLVGALAGLAGLLYASSALADVQVCITVSATGPGASLGVPEQNTVPLLPKEAGGQKLNYTAYREAVRSGQTDTSLQSFCLLLATAAYGFGVFFSSIAFDYHLAVIIGFTAANYRAWKQSGSRPLVTPASA